MNPSSDMETLWQAHHAKLLNYVKRRVTVDAEDVAQEVWLRACEAMQNGYGYREHASGWLYRIAHNLVIDLYRARQRTAGQVDIDELVDDEDDKNPRSVGDAIVCDAPGPDELAEKRALDAAIHAAIDRLTDTQAAVMRLRLEGQEFDDIGRALGKRPEACKALMHRSYEALHPHLAIWYGDRATERQVTRSNRSDEVRALLVERGPMSVPKLARTMRVSQGLIVHYLRGNGDIFARVGMTQGQRKAIPAWGVRGVHDQEQAA